MSKDVQVIARVGSILDALGESESASLKDISRATSLAVSTTSRLLHSLQQEGFVERDHRTKHYHIGRRFLRLAASTRPRRDIASILHPVLVQLSTETSEDAGLAELQGNFATFIDRVEGMHALRIIDTIGRPEPLYVGAFRKLLLSLQPTPWIKSYIRSVKFEKFTPNTLPNASALLKEIERIKKQGYATSFGERIADAAGVAAPIYDHTGRIRAVIQVAGPITRINKRSAKRYITAVLKAGEQATQLLSGRPPSSNGKSSSV